MRALDVIKRKYLDLYFLINLLSKMGLSTLHFTMLYVYYTVKNYNLSLAVAFLFHSFMGHTVKKESVQNVLHKPFLR